MAFKLVISNPKDGKSYQTDFEDVDQLIGKKMGEKIEGSHLGLSGYELEITGGSDQVGNPMRSDFHSSTARRILLTDGAGINVKRKGMRLKKRVHGNTIAADIIQVNMKVVKEGDKKLEDVLGKKEAAEGEEGAAPAEGEAPKEEKKEEKPAEEPKEEASKEEVKSEEPAAEEPKEEEKPAETKEEHHL